MILEGLVTTRNADGTPHLAPMGPMVAPSFGAFVFRPYPGSTTCANLLRTRCGVFHITDDARLIAYAAVGMLETLPAFKPATAINGDILVDACRAYEFRIDEADEAKVPHRLLATVVQMHQQREFLGFHRAKHAVIEAAILATRLHLLPQEDIAAEFRRLRVIVDKTGTPAEADAMRLLEAKLAEVQAR